MNHRLKQFNSYSVLMGEGSSCDICLKIVAKESASSVKVCTSSNTTEELSFRNSWYENDSLSPKNTTGLDRRVSSIFAFRKVLFIDRVIFYLIRVIMISLLYTSPVEIGEQTSHGWRPLEPNRSILNISIHQGWEKVEIIALKALPRFHGG